MCLFFIQNEMKLFTCASVCTHKKCMSAFERLLFIRTWIDLIGMHHFGRCTFFPLRVFFTYRLQTQTNVVVKQLQTILSTAPMQQKQNTINWITFLNCVTDCCCRNHLMCRKPWALIFHWTTMIVAFATCNLWLFSVLVHFRKPYFDHGSHYFFNEHNIMLVLEKLYFAT